jgi:hypothetical protein
MAAATYRSSQRSTNHNYSPIHDNHPSRPRHGEVGKQSSTYSRSKSQPRSQLTSPALTVAWFFDTTNRTMRSQVTGTTYPCREKKTCQSRIGGWLGGQSRRVAKAAIPAKQRSPSALTQRHSSTLHHMNRGPEPSMLQALRQDSALLAVP